MKRILVLCTGNSCRSQMAEGYLRHFLDDRIEVYSAGIEAHGVNSLAIKVMMEDDIDISAQTSNKVDEYTDISFDLIITVCDHANENCPVFPGKIERIHYNFPDPSKQIGNEEKGLNTFRKTRDLIKVYCSDIIHRLSKNLL